MINCLSIREALGIAEITGQVVKITLCSGKQLIGIVEKVRRTAFRIWLDPKELCRPEEDIRKVWVAIHAVKAVAFDCESETHECCSRSIRQEDIRDIRKVLRAAELTRQVVKVGLNCNGRPIKVRGRIISVSSFTFCIELSECNEVKEDSIENIEFVEFL